MISTDETISPSRNAVRKLKYFGGSFLIKRSAAVATLSRPKRLRNREVISTRDLARRMRKRLSKTTEELDAAVAKVENKAETAAKTLEAKRI
jgi:hypothetical protein